MEQEYGISLEAIINLSLFENALNVCAFWQYKRIRDYRFQKWLYVQNRDEFLIKLQIRYPFMTGPEISSFIRIYLASSVNENNTEASEFLSDDRILISRIFFMGPYLKEEGDYDFIWMNENGIGLHFP